MVSVVSGSGLGLVNTSRGVVGANGELGQAVQGRAGERVTVNAANGNLVIQNQDGLLVGVGADVGLLRTYNSLGGWDGDNGDAWRLGYYRRIGSLTGTLNAAGSTLVRTDADGFESPYTYRDGRYVGTDGAGAYDSLVIDASTATWIDGDTGLTETYSATAVGSYRLTQITDPDNHAIRVAYDAQGLIASLSTWKAGASSADETLTLVYDGNRRLTQVSTSTRGADGNLRSQTRVTYTYDTAGRLAGVVTDLSPEDNSTADGRSYSVNYTYDGAGRVRTVTQTDGTGLTIDYDSAGRVSRVTDAGGHATTFGYDSAARQATVTDALGQVATLGYDSAGRLGELSGTGFKTTFAYDAEGNLLSSTNGLGQQTVFGYDGHGNLIRSTDASGRVLERSFDAANRQTGETQYAQASVALTTRYVYDTTGGLRRLRFSLSAEGRVTEQQYNGLGQISSSLAYTRSAYTGAATLADLTAWAGQQAQQTTLQRADYGYDLRGQLASRTDAAGLTRYTYDAFGRLLQSIDATGSTTAFVYDGLDRLTLSTDALGATTVTSYDDAGYRTSVLAANGLRSVSTYNLAGLLVAQGQFSGSTALGETRYAYDAANRLRMTQDPTGQRQWMLYDEAGRRVGDVAADGSLKEYVYDGAGRMVRTVEYANRVSQAVLNAAAQNPATVGLRPGLLSNSMSDWVMTVDGDGTNFSSSSNLSPYWSLADEATPYLHQVGRAATTAYLSGPRTAVTAGQSYQVSAYTGAHRATVSLEVAFFDAAGHKIATVTPAGGVTVNAETMSGGAALSGYLQLNGSVTAPAGAVSARLQVRKGATRADQDDSWVFVAHASISQAIVPNQASIVDVRPVMPEVPGVAMSGWTMNVDGAATDFTTGADLSDYWKLAGETTPYLHQVGGAAISAYLSGPAKPVTAGQAYLVSVYTGAHRATVSLEVAFFDAAGNKLATVTPTGGTSVNAEVMSGGGALSGYLQLGGTVTAPAGAVTARIQVRKDPTNPGQGDSWVFIAQAQWGDVPHDRITHALYDAAGRKVGDIAADGSLTEYVYDGAGRMVRTVEYANRVSQAVLDAAAQNLTTVGLRSGLLSNSMSDWVMTVDGDGTNFSSSSNLSPYWSLADEATPYLHQVGRAATTAYLSGPRTAVTAGQSYQVSAYTGAHRATVSLEVAFFDAAGHKIATVTPAGGVTVNAETMSGGAALSGYLQLNGSVTAPAGAVSARLQVRKGATRADQDDSWVFVAHASISQAIVPNQASIMDVRPVVPEVPGMAMSGWTMNVDGAATDLTTGADLSDYWKLAGETTPYLHQVGGAAISAYLSGPAKPVTAGQAYLVSVYTGAHRATVSLEVAFFDAAGHKLATITPTGGTSVNAEVMSGGGALSGYLQLGGTVTAPAGAVTARIQVRKDPTNPGQGDSWVFIAHAQWGEAPPDRTIRNVYDADGLLRGTLDAEGYLTEMRYDATGLLVERIAYATATEAAQRSAGTLAQLTPTANSSDRHSVWFYDSQGRVQAEIDPDGWLTETSYNAAGQRTQNLRYARRITGPATPTSTLASLRPAASTEDQGTRWTYDALNRVLTDTAADGTVTRYSYDNVGNLTSTERAAGMAEARSLTQRYDPQGWLIAELSPEGSTKLAQATTQAQIDAVWSTYATQHAYDAASRRIRSTDARGSTTVYYFDAVGRLAYTILKTERGGEVQASRYNGFGEAITNVRYTRRLNTADTAALTGGQADAALDAKIAALADGSEARLQASYNQRGLIQQAIDALGFKTTSGYDTFGQLSRSEAETGDGRVLRTDYSHDRRGLLTATLQDPQALAIQTRTEYDAFGRVTASVDARGYRSTTQYLASDGAPDSGRQVSLTDPTGANSRITYDAFDRVIRQTDALGHSTTFSHDTANHRVTMTTAEGIVTVTESTRHGQVAKVTDGTGAATTYSYDKNGNLLSRTDALGNVTSSSYDAVDNLATQSAAGTLTRYSYDAASRLLTRQVDPDGLNLRSTYEYDGQGRAVKVTDAAGIVTSYRFDAKGELVETVVDDTATGLKLRTTTTYDAQGRTLSVTEGAGTATARTTEYRYDLLGRRIQEIIDPAGLKLTTGYEYDATGSVVLRRDTLGAITRYGYDELGRKLSEATDPSGLNFTTRYAYDAAGNLARVIDPAGRHTRYLYDTDNRLRNTLDAEYGLSENVYDAAGRIVRTTRYSEKQYGINTQVLTNGTVANSFEWITRNAVADEVTRYAYDTAGRQTLRVDALGAVTETKYDAAGRVTQTTQYANAIKLPTDGANDGKTVALSGNNGFVTTASYAAIDTSKTYRVRVRVRRLSGSGSVYVGVVTKDAAGNAITNPYQGTFSYAAAINVTLTPEMGWVTFEGLISGEAAIQAGTPYNKFLAGSRSAAPLLLYNYGDSNTDPGRLVEIDSMELIDVATGTVLNGGADMSAGAGSLNVAPSNVMGSYVGVDAALSTQDIRMRLRPDTALDRVTRYAYDAAGRQTHTVDAAGAVTELQYDAAGRVISRREYATPIALPANGSADGKTVALSGNNGFVTTASYAAIDTSKTYRVRVRVRRLSGSGSVYVGVVTKDAAGNAITNPYQGTFSYAAAINVTLTPEMGWVTFEGLISGEAAIQAGTPYNKFLAGSRSAAPLLLYNYGDSNTDPGRLVEIDSMELIDVATGTVLNGGADMSAGAGSLNVAPSNVMGSYVGVDAALSTQDIRMRLRPDTALDRVTRYAYDAAGRQTYTVDAAGAVTELQYDAVGRVISRREYATPIALPANGSIDGKTVVLSGNYAAATGTGYVAIDTAKTYKVRARLRQLSGKGTVYVGVISKDANGAVLYNPYQGRYSYAGGWADMTPEMGWVSFEGLISGEAAAIAGASYNAFLAGSKSASPLLLYNYYATTETDIGRLIEVDSLEFIDATTGAALNIGAQMQAGTGSLDVPASAISGAFSGVATALSSTEIQQRLRPDVARDRVTRYAYTPTTHPTQQIDPEGYLTTTTYDTFGNPIAATRYATRVQRPEALQQTPGSQVTILRPGDPIPTTGAYLIEEDPTRTRRTTLYFDKVNQLTLSIDAEGYAESSTHDAFGNLTSTTRHATPASAATTTQFPVLTTDPTRDATLRFEYDVLGRLVKRIDPEVLTGTAQQAYEATTYDAFGNRSSYRNKAGGLATYQYDARGLLLAETLPITTKTAAGTPIAVVNRHVYDAFGNRIQSIEAQGAPEQRSTRFEYDSLGRLLTTRGDALTIYTAAAGITANVTPTTTRVYDSAGNVIEQTDPNGNRTRSWYDALNRKIAEVDAAGLLSTWQRDAAGNVTVQRVYADPVLDPATAMPPSPPTPAATNLPRETRFSYDALNRQTEARVTGLDLRRYQEAADGSLTETTSSVARVAKVYDAAGNLVKSIDGNGGITYSYYDLANHKILEIDAEGYAIAWTRGADGSLLRETRFARRHPSPTSITEASTPAALLAAWPTDPADRITEFTYDRAGRLLTETRLNVAYGRVDATTGALTQAVGAATRRYAYDALDHKIREIDANGAQTDWLYDAAGRLLRQQGAAATDFEGAVVRATTEYEYDGLNNATRVIRRGKDDGTEADDQILRFGYGPGGRLLTQTDALNQVTTLSQDAAGNLTLRRYTRVDADGVAATEALAYRYDALNREVMRQNLWQPGTQPSGVPATGSWQAGDTHETRYNAWGEVTGRRTNGGNAAGDWQEFAEYNALGLVQKTNSGGEGQAGITRVYLYDANGNATVSLQSTGADLQPLSLAQVLASPATYRTLTVYDHRNQVVSVRQPRMDGTHDVLDVRQLVTQQVQDFAGGSTQINNVGAVLSTQPAGATPPPVLTDAQRFQTIATRVNWAPVGYDDGESGYVYTGVAINSVAVDFVPAVVGQSLGAWKSVRVKVEFRFSGSTQASMVREVIVTDRNAQTAVVNLGLTADVENVNFSYSVSLAYQYTNAADVQVAGGGTSGRMAWVTNEYIDDGEAGYRVERQNHFAAQAALDTSFKTADLGALATVTPNSDLNIWQDRVEGDAVKTTLNWSAVYDSEAGAYGSLYVTNLTVALPVASIQQTFGNGARAVTVYLDWELTGVAKASTQVSVTSTSVTSVTFPLNLAKGLNKSTHNFKYRVRVAYAANDTGTEKVLIAAPPEVNKPITWVSSTTMTDPEGYTYTVTRQEIQTGTAFNINVASDTANKTWFSGAGLNAATKAYFYYRTNATAPYTGVVMEAGKAFRDDGSTPQAPGEFYVWNSWLPAGITDYKIVAMNADKVVGSFNGSAPAATQGLSTASRSQLGNIFFDSYPAMHFFDQGSEQVTTNGKLDVTTPRLAVQYRRTGSSGAWAQMEIGAYQPGGWFSWPWQASGLSGAYDLRILRMDAAGAVKSRLFTQVNLSATPSATALVPYAESDLVLGNQPATATSLTFRYRPVGSTGGWISTSFAKRGDGLFGRDFQNDNLLPGVITPTSQADYEYQYEATDAAGQVVNGATGSFRITPNAKQFLSHTGTRAPTVVSFVIEPANALKMALRYRALGSNGVPVGDYSTLTLTRPSNKEPFRWDASTLTPVSGSASYQYEYRLLDGAGNPVLNPVGEAIVVQGTATVGQVTQQAPQTTWVATGSVSTANTIVRRQASNAFGEVQNETDGRGNTTTLAYNTLGQLVQKLDPQTDVTGENGVTTRATPQTRYVYDLAGRAVGTRDANGYWSTQVWQEGQAQPQIAREFHADFGRVERAYDVFGNLRSSTDAEGRQTRYRYDQNDQLLRVDRPARAAGQYLAGQAGWEQYEYDSQGQRIAATTVLGRSRQYFDLQGRVSRTTSIEGRSTSYAYTWDNTITGAGGRQVGGWRKTTTLIGGMVAVDKSDVFGRMTWRQDYGGHVFSYGYNLAGWLMSQSSIKDGQAGQSLAYEYYANGYLKRQTDFVTRLQSNYAYDDNGNRVFEEARRTDDPAAVYYSSSIAYDELNRVKQVKDQQYTITTKYDAAGNRRNVHSYYQDGVDGSQATQDLWYLYDPMNRFTVTMGELKDGLITRGTTGKLIAYNKAGERMVAEYTADDGKTQYSERYTYTSDGYLQDMLRSVKPAGSSSFTVQTQPAATRQTDLAGRVLNYTERNADNSIRSNLGREYDRDNRQLKEYDYTKLTDGAPRTDTYGYNTDGTLAQIVTSNVDTGLTRRYSYEWWDSAQQKSITLQAQNEAAPGWDKGTSLFTYDANGHLVRATDVQGKRTIQYISDADGQILYRQEVAARNGVASDWHWFSDSDPSLGGEVVAGDVARKRHYYYLSGHRIGDVNNEGPQPNGVDYAEALAQSKTAEPTKFAPTAYANFDANYQAINESYPGPTGTDYTVQKGDTLQGIAERLWGDRSLWYLIAEANGLVGAEALTEGMRLEIPNKVTNIHNNSGTVGVYDAGAAIGDTSPTLPAPPPPPKNGCGALGMIIMIAIVVVVSIYTAGAAAGYLGAASTSLGATGTAAIGGAAMSGGTLLAGTGGFALGTSAATAMASAAIGGAVGSIAGQGFAIAAGMQDHFEWRQVGQSALSAGVASGVGAGLNAAKLLTSGSWLANAGRAALSTGANLLRQEKWNWQSVMASAAGGAAGTLVRDALGSSALGATMGLRGRELAAGFAGGVVSGWAGPGGRADYLSAFASAAANSYSGMLEQQEILGNGLRIGPPGRGLLGNANSEESAAYPTRVTAGTTVPTLKEAREIADLYAQGADADLSLWPTDVRLGAQPSRVGSLSLFYVPDGVDGPSVSGFDPQKLWRGREDAFVRLRTAARDWMNERIDRVERHDKIYNEGGLPNRGAIVIGNLFAGAWDTVTDAISAAGELISDPARLAKLPAAVRQAYEATAPVVEAIQSDPRARDLLIDVGRVALATLPHVDKASLGASAAVTVGVMIMSGGIAAEARGAAAAEGLLSDLGLGERAAELLGGGVQLVRLADRFQTVAAFAQIADAIASPPASAPGYAPAGFEDVAATAKRVFKGILSTNHLKRLGLSPDLEISVRPSEKRHDDLFMEAWQGGVLHYRDPATGRQVPFPAGVKPTMDHVFPVKEILGLDGVDRLTPNQLKHLLTWDDNFQLLPGGINSSKGANLGREWKSYPAPDGSGRVQIPPAQRLQMERQQLRIRGLMTNWINQQLGKGI